jgi:uncharacterized protein (DUF1015 family)
MADVRAFSSIRPREDLGSKIAALPYDVYNTEEARVEVSKEPLSFLSIDRAETQLEEGIDVHDERVYQKAHDRLWEMVDQGEFIKDDSPSYYIYELTMDGRTQTGLTACVSIDDYLKGVVKKHENTRADKEIDRIRHVDSCNAQTGPIFLAYHSNERLNQIISKAKKEKAIYDFIAPDGVRHHVWRIKDGNQTKEIKDIFQGISHLYIADGHHRAASAVKVGLKRREEKKDYTGEEEFNYFLSVLFPDNELAILDYNRVVKDLNGLGVEDFLNKVAEKFIVEKVGNSPVSPSQKGEMGMYLDSQWYRLRIQPEYVSKDPVKNLDVSILQEKLLSPILGIGDPKIDQRIDFVGGIRGLGELERRVAKDCKVAFSLYPTSIEELFSVADAGLLMPPKSTWFEPKLRSGLFIHSLD